MNQFIASSRKYRPTTFKGLKGQPHVTQTLLNGLKKNSLAQVFLFCGPKGTGKTSCARILGKAINCTNRDNSGEPCNTCASCLQFLSHRALNLYELDAASYNSVDHVRQLREQVRFQSGQGKKIFIIDEAHMLSNAAFNAFLKTLEEPPKHVVFILATTEKYKILPTILSRCQIFDFHAHSPEGIRAHLEEIAKKEAISYEPSALDLISAHAEGALRDALAQFDLVVTFQGGNTLTYEATLKHLHLLDHRFFFKLLEAIQANNIGAAWSIFHECMEQGFEGVHFLTGLSYHLRNMFIAQKAPHMPFIQVPAAFASAYTPHKTTPPPSVITAWWKLVDQSLQNYQRSTTKQLDIELLLLEMANKFTLPQPSTAAHASEEAVPNQVKSSAPDNQPTTGTPPTKAAEIKQMVEQQSTSTTSKQPSPPLLTKPSKEWRPQFLSKLKLETPTANEGIIKKNEQPVPSSETDQSPALFPSEEKIRATWLAYAEKVQEKQKGAYYLLTQKQLNIANQSLTLEVDNLLEKNLFDDSLQPALLKQFKMAFPGIAWQIGSKVVRKQGATPPPKVVFSSQERWRILKEKQPVLKKISEQLALKLQ